MTNCFFYRHQKTIWQIFRYGIVGFITLGLYLAVNWTLIHVALEPGISASIAMLIAGVFNYIAHTKYTFEVNTFDPRIFAKFTAVLVVNSFAAGLMVNALMGYLTNFEANLVVLVIIMISTFTMMRIIALRS